MTWGIPTELWIQKRDTIIALQYSTYSLLFFMTGKHWDQSKELSKNCSSNFKWLGVIWGLDWLRQICSHCSWFEHELAVLIILLLIWASEWVSAGARLSDEAPDRCASPPASAELLKSACRSPCIPSVSPPTADAATTGLESRVSVDGD